MYDPKKAKTKARQKASRTKSSPLTTTDIRECVGDFTVLLHECKFNTHSMSDMSDRHKAVRALHAALSMFSSVFNKEHGDAAFRKYAPFQQLVAVWKARPKPSNKVFRESKLEEFADFMDKEAAREVPTAVEFKPNAEVKFDLW